MKKQSKQYFTFVLLIITFTLLSAFNISLIIKKNGSDMILLYTISCFLFVLWFLGTLFKMKLLRLFYKVFQRPMSKSMTMDVMGISVVSEKKAYETFKKMIKTLPYIYLSILVIGILVLLLF